MTIKGPDNPDDRALDPLWQPDTVYINTVGDSMSVQNERTYVIQSKMFLLPLKPSERRAPYLTDRDRGLEARM